MVLYASRMEAGCSLAINCAPQQRKKAKKEAEQHQQQQQQKKKQTKKKQTSKFMFKRVQECKRM